MNADMEHAEALRSLIELSREVGRPEEGLVILGEGNTSVGVDEQTFYVKASGTELRTADENTFVLVKREPVMDLLDRGQATDSEIDSVLNAAVVGENKAKPSVETLMHAYFQGIPGVKYVVHTHPISVNSILCSKNAFELLSGRIFPDEIVCCGLEHVFVPYVDPGLTLAKEIRQRCEDYMAVHGRPPRSILMQNHGLIVLSSSTKEALSACKMWVKAATILMNAAMLGGVNYLTPEQAARIEHRPDEEYRRRILAKE
jgi:rhamnose utilization protein RhaD (predicted bifunctional aldolase and dehydrogenase)